MSDIEWTDETWNPVTGCTKVSPGCAHCYAETFAERWRGVPGHPFEQGFALKLWPERLTLPLKWKKPRRIFVNSMSDLFHEDVPFEFIDRVFAVMALTPQHTYQVLTKRPERMREYLTTERHGMPTEGHVELAKDLLSTEQWGIGQFLGTWPLPNVWLGTSTENQHWLDIRVPELLATPAAVRFLSCEPLLGSLDLKLAMTRAYESGYRGRWPGWVIVGGESGPKARPFDLAWARSIVSQCRAAGVPVFVKQLGANVRSTNDAGFDGDTATSWPDGTQHNVAASYQGAPLRVFLKSRKGGDMAEWPEDLRVREWPV